MKKIPEFPFLFRQLRHSGCAKKQIAAGTYVNGIFLWAVNRCDYDGPDCPRLGMPSGKGYDLCQAHHAEAELVEKIMSRIPCEPSDGIAWVAGHYWACEPCAALLKKIGVKEIRVRETE